MKGRLHNSMTISYPFAFIVDGGYTQWTSWTACGVTCGYSTQTRARTCTNPIPQYLGADCSGDADESQQCYAGIMCPSKYKRLFEVVYYLWHLMTFNDHLFETAMHI